MEARQIPLVVAVGVCVALLIAVPVSGVGAGGGQTPQVDTNTTDVANETDGTDGTNETNGSFGGQISAFMQTSAVDANTTVESGMWSAGVNTSVAPEKDVTTRADRLERTLTRLEERASTLEQTRANGTLPAVAYTAQASAIRERIVNLREQINGTERAAKRVGLNVSGLDRLRTQATNLTGPEVSAIARNITDAPRGPPEDVPGGPPERAGPLGNGTGPPSDAGPPENESGPPSVVGPSGNESGPPKDVGLSGNESGPRDNPEQLKNETGPPSDLGPSGNETGPRNDVGQAGNETGPPADTGPSSDETTLPGTETGPSADTDPTNESTPGPAGPTGPPTGSDDRRQGPRGNGGPPGETGPRSVTVGPFETPTP